MLNFAKIVESSIGFCEKLYESDIFNILIDPIII